jgi:NADH dehydrogenase
MPDALMALAARMTGWLPGAPITWDQWLMLQSDNVVASAAKGMANLGITPTPMDAVAPGWLVLYRKHGRFSDPANTKVAT